MLRITVVSLMLVSTTQVGIPEQGTQRVTCVAVRGYHCANSEGGCKTDKVYTIIFTVDRAAGTILDSTGQKYAIVPIKSLEMLGGQFEYAIQAFTQVGLAATEIVVLGERSFVSSNVSVAPPRAYVQIGTCSGLKRPQ